MFKKMLIRNRLLMAFTGLLSAGVAQAVEVRIPDNGLWYQLQQDGTGEVFCDSDTAPVSGCDVPAGRYILINFGVATDDRRHRVGYEVRPNGVIAIYTPSSGGGSTGGGTDGGGSTGGSTDGTTGGTSSAGGGGCDIDNCGGGTGPGLQVQTIIMNEQCRTNLPGRSGGQSTCSASCPQYYAVTGGFCRAITPNVNYIDRNGGNTTAISVNVNQPVIEYPRNIPEDPGLSCQLDTSSVNGAGFEYNNFNYTDIYVTAICAFIQNR